MLCKQDCKTAIMMQCRFMEFIDIIYRIYPFNLPENCPKMLNSFAVGAFLRPKAVF